MSGHGTPRVPPGAVAVPSGGIPSPSNFLIGLTNHGSGALPAAGAFRAPSNAAVPAGTKRVTFWISYTRGAAGGAPVFRAEFYNTSGQAFRACVQDLSSFAAAAPEGSTNFYLEDLIGPAPADGNPINFELTFELPAYAVGVDLRAAESGAVGTPGTCDIAFTADG